MQEQDTTEMPIITEVEGCEDEDVIYQLPESTSTDDSSFEDVTPEFNDEDKPSATDNLSMALNKAEQAALGAQQSIREGIAAFRDVRAASQRHADARDELSYLQESLEAHSEELQYRLDIEQRYPQIVATQTAELNEARAIVDDALERRAQLEAERNELDNRLTTLKVDHEDQLRPYRNLAESTKGRADDAARALAEAKRATRAAEAGLSEATKRRDQRITAAHRTVDNAQERLRRVQAELEAQKSDQAPDPDTLERLQNEYASETAHLEAAQSEVTTVTEEMRRSVETAQQRLFDQRQIQSQAERDAEATRREATERRNEYDKMLKQAQEQERSLSEQIKQRVAGIELAQQEGREGEARIAAAQEILDEAEAIHSTPQDTIALREQVAREQTDCAVQQDMVDELAADERGVRKDTFKLRLTLILLAVGILLVILAIILLLVLRKR